MVGVVERWQRPDHLYGRGMTAPTERRFAPVEIREEGGELFIEGVGIRYGDVADMGAFRERLEPGTFGDLKLADLILNIMHDRRRPLARTDGGGLSLSDNGEALRISARLPSTREAEDAVRLVRARVLRGFSIEMRVARGGESFTDGIRVISSAKLLDLGLVDRPAYGDSFAAVSKRLKILAGDDNGYYLGAL